MVEETKKQLTAMDKQTTLILGSGGMLGQEMVKVFGGAAIGWDRKDFDFLNITGSKQKISDLKPSAIINCVAYNNVDKAEDERELAFKTNAESVGELAKICDELGVILVHFSTNYVFDGEKGDYIETDQPRPLSSYGESKYMGEKLLQENCRKFYLIRTAVLFGHKGRSAQTKPSFVELMLALSDRQEEIKAVDDEFNNPTSAVELAKQVKLLLERQKAFGTYHIINSGSASWYDFAKEIFLVAHKTVKLIPVPRSQFPVKAKRPKKATLKNTKLRTLGSWQQALKENLLPIKDS